MYIEKTNTIAEHTCLHVLYVDMYAARVIK